jgi:hypothetical protein
MQRNPPGVDLHTLERFVASVPALRDALSAPMSSPCELLLLSEIRRTVRELSNALQVAADGEPNRVRAAVFLAASMVAADLATERAAPRIGH